MAQHFLDFSSYTVGNTPSDWTLNIGSGDPTVESVSGAEGGVVLECETGSTEWTFSYDEVSHEDIEVLGKFRADSTDGGFGLVARAQGDTSYLGYVWTGDDTINLAYLDNGSWNFIDDASFTFSANTWYWMRLRVNGSDISIKIWEDGQSEPGSWNISTTDNNITGSGDAGIYLTSTNALLEYDIIGIGTNGDTAPSESPVQDVDMPADNGQVVVAGQTADLFKSYTLTAEDGVLDLTGGDATLFQTYILDAEHLAISLAGQDANLLRSLLIEGDSGTITLAGQQAGLLRSLLSAADNGAIILAGQDVAFQLATVLSVGHGVVLLEGQAIEIQIDHLFSAENGSVLLAGQAADLLRSLFIQADNASITLAGQEVNTFAGLRTFPDAGLLTLAGQEIASFHDSLVAAEAASILLQGQEIDFSQDHLIKIEAGLITYAGQEVETRHRPALELTARHGRIILAGQEPWLLGPHDASYTWKRRRRRF